MHSRLLFRRAVLAGLRGEFYVMLTSLTARLERVRFRIGEILRHFLVAKRKVATVCNQRRGDRED